MKFLKYFAFIAFVLIPTSSFATHSWSVYHWSSNKLAPTVVDATKSTLYDVPAGIVEWADLGTPIQPTLTSGNGDIVVKEFFSPWYLGLARIYIDELGHITKGEVKLNTRLLTNYGPEVADHVLCQEIGHVLGLDHNRLELDTCMNDTTALSNTAPYPNFHDAEQLNLIYSHVDVEPPVDDTGPGGPPCSKKPDHPNCRAIGWLTVHVFKVP